MLITQHYGGAAESAQNLDELLQEIESLSQEWSGRRRLEDEDESEEAQTCLLLHAPGNVIIDTRCGRCVIGAQTLEEQLMKVGRDAEDVQWHEAHAKVTFYYRNGTKDHTLGVVDVPCVMCGMPLQITVYVVPGQDACLLRKGWLKEHGAIIDAQACLLKMAGPCISTALIERVIGRYEVNVVRDKLGSGD